MRYLAVFIALCAIAFCSNESYAQGKITRNKQESVSHRSTTKKAVSKNKGSNKEGTYGYLNGHEWIDLGLPSGTKWATMNIGASYSSTDYGDYYAWGEVATPSDGNYSSEHCKLYGRKMSNISGSAYDVAQAKWGIGWVLPEKKDVIELDKYCSIEWVTVSNVEGTKITGPNGNSIFLPMAGAYMGDIFVDVDLAGYWIGTEHDYKTAYVLPHWNGSDIVPVDKYFGRAVRAITRVR